MAPISFGFLTIPYQLLDVSGPLDVLSSCSKIYLAAAVPTGIPAHIADAGIDIEFHHIGLDLSPVKHTGGFYSAPTTTVATCPPLDYLLIGGPDPSYLQEMPDAFVDFVRQRVGELKTLFTTCTGGMVLARCGLLDGVNATTHHAAVPMAQQIFPNVKWTKEKQWVIDGKFWTSGGACAGMDMMASWVMQNYGMEVAMAGFSMLDYEPRTVDKTLMRAGALPN